MRRRIVTVSVLVGVLAGAAAADKIVLSRNMVISVDRITGFKDGDLTYTNASAQERTRSLKDVVQIAIDGQDSFNKAEELRAGDKVADATGLYDGVISNGDTPAWLAQLARYRKVEALGKDKSIASAVSTWLDIVATDTSPAVITLMPHELADKGDERNAQAISALESRMGEIKSNVVRTKARELLMQLYRREGQDDKADKIAATLAGAVPPRAGTEGDPSKVTASSVESGEAARTASSAGAGGLIRAGQKPAVLAEQAARLTDSLPQCIAAEVGPTLVLIGKARLYQALPMSEKTDADARKGLLVQAGVSFMRAKVAATKAPVAAEALLYAGRVNELLGNTQAAEKAYEKVTTDPAYKSAKDIVEEAKGALAKLSGKKPG
ncbi:MAG: hypothetical protein NTV86_01245 [Planctomycetota bacterium]|nr:hypothetical protein [Planctomycetota bacterium]